MGIDVDSDGSGALLFVELKDVPGMIRQYCWRLDFTGRRWLELPNGEVAIEQYYDHAPWNARWDHAVKWFDYSKIGSIAIGLTELKTDAPASCIIHSVQFLSEIAVALDGLVVQTESESVSIPVRMSFDQYLRVEAGGATAIYDRDWHRVAELPVAVNLPVASSGKNEWSVTPAAGTAGWINVRACFSKEPESIA
jgi:hypothetical protein